MLFRSQCGGRENCKDEDRCMTHELWSTLNFKLYEYLTSVTLSDLVDKQVQKVGSAISILRPVRRVGPSPRGKSIAAMA